MRYSLLILLPFLRLPSISHGQDAKIVDESESTVDIIYEQEIEKDIIRNLELLKNFNLVENLQEYESLAEIMEYEEDD